MKLDLDLIKIANRQTKKSNFIVTSYVLGTKVNALFYSALKCFCKHRNADLLIIPLKNGKNQEIDELLRNDIFVIRDVNLNKNLIVSSIFFKKKPSFNAIGTGRLGKESVILGGTLQDISYIANGKDDLAKGRFVPGALNDPDYLKDSFNDKGSVLADSDHKLGAIVVEAEDINHFHIRPIQFIDGGFTDLGIRYSKSTFKKEVPEAIVLGDYHSGETDLTLINEISSLSNKLGVVDWVLHDTFSGSSINHHEQHNLTKRSIRADIGKLSLKNELEEYERNLDYMISKLKKRLIIVKSNHDEFLERYLSEGRYISEPQNLKISLKLHLMLCEGLDPINKYLEGKLDKNKVIWLKRDESYLIKGIECGSHGDRGSNGVKRGSPQMLENAFLKSVTGHTHTPRLFREVFIVGTSTAPYPDYGDGPSSWVQTSCIINKDGSRQLINYINGKYTTFKL